MKKNPASFFSYFLMVYFLIGQINDSQGQGHYMGASFNPNDYFVAVPGVVIPTYYGFSNMNFYNSNGDKSDRIINPIPGNPTSLNLKQNVKTNSFIVMAIYGGKKKFLKANWGMMVIPTLNNPTANIALDYFSTTTGAGSANITSGSWGLGDVYVQPLWLTWNQKKWTYGVAYGVWAAWGRYKTGDAKNVGMGYWSHNLRASARYKPNNNWSFTGAITQEWNSKQKGVDFKEAAHITLDYGLVYSLPKSNEIGLFGFYTRQQGLDKGTQGSFLSDRYMGIGGYGSVWLKPGKLSLLGRITQHFNTINRFSGTAIQIGCNLLFLNLPKTP